MQGQLQDRRASSQRHIKQADQSGNRRNFQQGRLPEKGKVDKPEWLE